MSIKNICNLLDKVNFPSDLKKLTTEEMVELSAQLRQFIIDAASHNPGHLGANLGVVELTIALHHVFDTPNDKIIWDVGHQAYAHKILTGRKDIFHTNRKYGGISGFPNLAESQYDAFGVGHSSTSISAALGIATASKLLNEKRQVVAVIGDGSLTGGMAFEALNHAGAERANMLVILNDNKMAIDPSVGALK
jgi:1-deoxy-D-xylulose-5-phosphate synthase